MKDRIKAIAQKAPAEIARSRTYAELENLRIKYLGRKGELTQLFKELSFLPPPRRPLLGRMLNELKQTLQDALQKAFESTEKRQPSLTPSSARPREDWIDITLPGRKVEIGRVHPITTMMEEITEVFCLMGFQIVLGPDIELDYYNFEALNMPPDHPARDMQDTFYLPQQLLLRTHTSPVQIRFMEKNPPPLKIIVPGTVFRRDYDISHTPMFHQVEGLMVDKDINFGHLKGVLSVFAQQIFGAQTNLRFRPSFFPFTEPSAEVDIQCVICGGKGCRVCSQKGWLEILGAGLVDPEVFRFVGYDPEAYTGFAFGLGVERIVMLKYGITDLRLFFENDLQFLRQF